MLSVMQTELHLERMSFGRRRRGSRQRVWAWETKTIGEDNWIKARQLAGGQAGKAGGETGSAQWAREDHKAIRIGHKTRRDDSNRRCGHMFYSCAQTKELWHPILERKRSILMSNGRHGWWWSSWKESPYPSRTRN